LLNDVQSFLMEMGRGFALAGRQFPLRIIDEETGQEDEFFIDLLLNPFVWSDAVDPYRLSTTGSERSSGCYAPKPAHDAPSKVHIIR